MEATLFLLTLLSPVLFGALSLLFPKSATAGKVGALGSVLAGLLGLYPAFACLLMGQPTSVQVPWSVPGGSLTLGLDGLSALFFLMVSLVVPLSAIFGQAYLGSHGRRSVWGFYGLLHTSLLLVVSAQDAILFLVAWELMAVSSYFLVIHDDDQAEVRKAGWTYLVATHLGTLCLFLLFAALGQRAGGLTFGAFTLNAGDTLLFTLAVIGFGTKAGFVPLHVWLPEAHPAAPSHVSAVLSAVMIKTGLYGLLRILSFMDGPPPAGWGAALLCIGGGSALAGVVMALAQTDLKRVLAYSSVENMGLMTLGLGLGLLGLAYGLPAMAALGVTAALLHAFAHSLMKSLLFLGAGAVVHSTHTRSLEKMGGLLSAMPKVGLAFLIGSVAISGLPPLNGLMGEALLLLAGFSGIEAPAPLAVAAIGAVVVVALVSGLAVACFARLVGVAFLGAARSPEAASAKASSLGFTLPLLSLATLCVLSGLAAPALVRLVEVPVTQLIGAPTAQSTQPSIFTTLLGISAVGAGIAGLALGLVGLRRLLLSGRSVEDSATWGCGYTAPSTRMAYTAESFAEPLLFLFRGFLGPRVKRSGPEGIFAAPATLEVEAADRFKDQLFAPVFRLVGAIALALRPLQQGRVQLYVLYVAVTVLALLVWKL